MCIPQPGTSQRLDTLGDRLMYRMAYRNFGSHQAIVVNHTVDVDGSDRAGVRWYDLSKTTGNWSIAQQSTYAPADGLHRWMGSAAMDHDGNMAIGFSTRSAADTYPSIRYAGQARDRSAEPAPAGRATLVAGTGNRRPTLRPLGRLLDADDDPIDDCTFWYTTSTSDDRTGRMEDADR